MNGISKEFSAIYAKPDFSEAHYTLGTALQQKGELDAAIAEFREAIKIAPNSPQVHNTLGTALRQKGKNDEARVEFDEAARLVVAAARNKVGAAG